MWEDIPDKVDDLFEIGRRLPLLDYTNEWLGSMQAILYHHMQII